MSAIINSILNGLLFRKASSSKDTSTASSIRVETDSNESVRLTHTKLKKDGGRIGVVGRIMKNKGYAVAAGSHLHLVALDSHGKVVVDKVARCDLSRLVGGWHGRADTAMYAGEVDEGGAAIQRIRIVYHGHAHSLCSAKKCGKSKK